MKVGIFDHVEQNDLPLATQFEERLRYVSVADELGFYCYHVAEHHASPLNMVPRPGVFLAAVARASKRIRLGPLVYLLPLYSPLSLLEEISILDHLSNGRLEIGIGRGVSPYELKHHKVSAEESRAIFIDAFECISAGLATDKLTYKGKYYDYQDVPIALRPLQHPSPAFWYGSSNATGSTWAGERGLHFVTNGATARAKANITAFKEALAKRGGPAHPKPEFRGGAVIGVSRQVVVANTDEQAVAIAKPAHERHHANLTYLWRLNIGDDLAVRQAVPMAASFDDAIRDGTMVVGSPATVREKLEQQRHELGINYLLSYMMFGTMPLSAALHSLNLFASEVMPHLGRG